MIGVIEGYLRFIEHHYRGYLKLVMYRNSTGANTARR